MICLRLQVHSHWPLVYNRWIILFCGNRKSPLSQHQNFKRKKKTLPHRESRPITKGQNNKATGHVKFPFSISLALFNFPILRLKSKVAMFVPFFIVEILEIGSYFTSQWIGSWFTGWLDSWMASWLVGWIREICVVNELFCSISFRLSSPLLLSVISFFFDFLPLGISNWTMFKLKLSFIVIIHYFVT